MWRLRTARPRTTGQAMFEFALVFPLFVLVVFALIVYGLHVFYSQQLSNAAREAARFAIVHTATAQYRVVSQLDPVASLQREEYERDGDSPENGWPQMTAAARSKVWGMSASQVSLTACWSGYVDPITLTRDQLPTTPGVVFMDCTISGINPQTDAPSLPCPAPMTTPSSNPDRENAPADGDDKASALAVVAGSTGADTHYPTTVTVYACFNWAPPLAGVGFKVPWGTWSIGMPQSIPIRAVVTEALQRQ
jgi:hypothetical protein